MLLEPFIKVVIARYVGLAEVAYFEIANKIVYQIRSLFERGVSAIMPEVSRLSAEVVNAKSKITNVMKKIIRMNFLIGTSVFIVLFILCEPLLKLWLSDEYNRTIILAFRIIVLGYTVNLISVPMYYYFMGIGRVKYCFYNHSIQALLNFTLIMAFISANIMNFSLVSIVYSVSIAISAIILIYFYYRNTGVTV
jgi:O-antigen/teichoic acid export membrane protein